MPETGKMPLNRRPGKWQLTKSEEKVRGAAAVINSFFPLIKRLKFGSVSAASCGCDSDAEALDDAEIH